MSTCFCTGACMMPGGRCVTSGAVRERDPDLIPDPVRYWSGLERAIEQAPTVAEHEETADYPEPLL